MLAVLVKCRPPQCVAQHCGLARARTIFVFGKSAPQNRRDAQHRRSSAPRRSRRARSARRRPGLRRPPDSRLPCRQSLARNRRRTPGTFCFTAAPGNESEESSSSKCAGLFFDSLMSHQRRDAVRLRIRQGPQQKAVQQTEDGRVDADRQGQRHHHRRRKSRTPVQLPQCETKVFDHATLLTKDCRCRVPCACWPGFYSVRSASMGSTAVARRAGSAEASATMTAVSSRAAARVTGSQVLTP